MLDYNGIEVKDRSPLDLPIHVMRVTAGRYRAKVSKSLINLQSKPPKRDQVNGFSVKSARRLRTFIEDSIVEYRVMITLTVRKQQWKNGLAFKCSIDKYLKWLNRNARMEHGDDETIDWSALWTLEFTKNGTPHLHVYTTHWVDRTKSESYWAEKCIGDVTIRNTCQRMERIRGSRGGMSRYATKYITKNEQKSVPEWYKGVGRFWGIRGNRNTITALAVVVGKRESEEVYEKVKGGLLGMADNETGIWETEECTCVSYAKGGDITARIAKKTINRALERLPAEQYTALNLKNPDGN